MVTNIIVQYVLLKHSELFFSKVAYPLCAYSPKFLVKATDSVLVRTNP